MVVTDHASARKDVPAQADSIAILDLTPLLFQGVVVHDVGAVSGCCVSNDGYRRVGCVRREGDDEASGGYMQAVISADPV